MQWPADPSLGGGGGGPCPFPFGWSAAAVQLQNFHSLLHSYPHPSVCLPQCNKSTVYFVPTFTFIPMKT